uniref:Uncharacterized protein n=1 Tax=Anopheles albimanus TaxID=7167 RepID=A0A182F146_ANOAL
MAKRHTTYKVNVYDGDRVSGARLDIGHISASRYRDVCSTSQLIAHSSRVRTPQRHNSESILYMSNDDQSSLGGVSQSTGSLHHSLTHRQQQQQQQQHNLSHHRQHRHSHLLANGAGGRDNQASSSSSLNGGSASSATSTVTTGPSAAAATVAPGSGSPTGSVAASSVSSSASNTRSSRSNNRLFPISTYTEPPGSTGGSSGQSTGGSPAIGGSVPDFKQLNTHNWQSVAERINELEKHQQQQQHHGINQQHNSSSTSNLNSSSTSSGKGAHLNPLNIAAAAAAAAATANANSPLSPPGKQRYTYFDPSKTHRVSNPSLKAFQKNAVISYFERQQQHARESIHKRPTSLNLSASGASNSNSGGSPNSGSSSSPQLSTPASGGTTVATYSQRSSISSAYSSAAGSMMELSSNGGGTLSMGNYSPPSSLAVQQQLDKLAVNNLRNQLASVHTMNLLNKPPGMGPSIGEQQHQHQQQMISNATLILSSAQTNGLPATGESHMMASDSHDMISAALDGAPPPPPPPRNRASMIPMGTGGGGGMLPHPSAHMATIRRTSSASEYSSIRDKLIQQRQQLSKDLLGPMIMGPIIALDDWVPERPPKNPMLRIPSPELPPPPPMLSPTEDVLMVNQDEPLPPPPPEILRHMRQLSDSGDCRSNSASRRNSFAGQTNKKSLYRASTFENLSPPGPQHPGPQQSAVPQNGIAGPPAVPKKPQQPTQAQHTTDVSTPVNGHRRPASSLAKTQIVPSLASPASIHHHQAAHLHRMQHANGRTTHEQQQQQQQQQQHRLSLPLQQTAHSQSGLVMPVQPQFVAGRQSDTRISVRKRTHNSQQIPVSEYLMK